MQTLNWYFNRLKVMSAGEILWRSRSSVRDYTDRFLLGKRKMPRKPSVFLNGNGQSQKSGFNVCDISAGNKTDVNQDHWYESLLARAEKIYENKLDFFDLKEKYLGEPVKWNYDHKLGLDTPMIFSV